MICPAGCLSSPGISAFQCESARHHAQHSNAVMPNHMLRTGNTAQGQTNIQNAPSTCLEIVGHAGYKVRQDYSEVEQVCTC